MKRIIIVGGERAGKACSFHKRVKELQMAYNEDEEVLTLSGDTVIDLTDAEFKPVSEGWHPIQCEEITPTRSKAGNGMLNIKSRVQDPDPEMGSILYFRTMLEGRGTGYTFEFFKCIGFVPTKDTTVDDMVENIQDAYLDVLVEHQENPNTGKLQANVANYRKLSPVSTGPSLGV